MTHTVVIMTSNLGSHFISELGGRNWEEARRRVMEALRQHFRPEFLNRVDDIVMFRALSEEQLAEIVGIQLGELERRLAERGVGLVVTDAARRALAEEGFDPVYGARPLRRTIQRRIQDPLALRLLEGEYADGDTVVVDWDGAEYTFRREETVRAAV
jgi:ATP-dependent Clp protease ATP-binding subunit ClpB